MSATLVDRNRELIDQGIRLLRGLPNDAYAATPRAGSLAPALGPHFRHCLEFYLCFLDGLEHRLIDYDARARRAEIERDRELAIGQLAAVAERLGRIDREALDAPVALRDAGSVEAGGGTRLASSVGRELLFLASHTVHHYALIALALRLGGHPVPSGFGVAPSTLEHWRREGRT